ncbi:MAG: hypothetical protein ACRD1P_13365 [Thermoanaerobaculia bacterium]
MKKLVGTILAVVSLVALVPNIASAAGPLPPTRSGGSSMSNGGGGSNGVSNSGSTRRLPPLSRSGRGGLPPVKG